MTAEKVEERLTDLGVLLRDRPSLRDDVLEQIRTSRVEVAIADRPTRMPFRSANRWPAASVASLASAVCLLALALWFVSSPGVSWADVNRALVAQKWIRATATYGSGQRGTLWLAPESQVWAFHSTDTMRFSDGRQRVKYEYSAHDKQVVKLPLGESESRQVFPIDELSRDGAIINPWLFETEKIVDQKRIEVVEDGKKWIEIQLVMWRGPMSRATLRVDPETKLPVSMLLTSPTDAKMSIQWHFDYPADGPSDIFALGVPHGTKVIDQMPVNQCLQVLEAMAASRARIGDYRMIVSEFTGYPKLVVVRKGDRWRIDWYRPKGQIDPMAKPPEGLAWEDWINERVKLCDTVPAYLCDGTRVFENSNRRPDGTNVPKWQVSRNTAPQDLMSGEAMGNLELAYGAKIASLLFPNLNPLKGWGFEFDPRPADAPGCVVIKRSARTTSIEPSVGHSWFYIDPAKAHAVVRVEVFSSPPDKPADATPKTGRQTTSMEGFQQSPSGIWFPTTIAGFGASRLHFEFDPAVPVSLFDTGDQNKIGEK